LWCSRLFVLLFGFCCLKPFLAGLVVDWALGLGVHVGGAHCRCCGGGGDVAITCIKQKSEMKMETDDDDDA
jgi:hypothetical protein